MEGLLNILLQKAEVWQILEKFSFPFANPKPTVFAIFCEGEVAGFSAKRWDRRNRADLIESATPCHDAQVVGLYRVSNTVRLTVLAAISMDYTTVPQHFLSLIGSYISFL